MVIIKLYGACMVSFVQKRPWVRSPAATLGFFFSSSWLTNLDEMKDLWCSSTVWLLSTQT